MKLQAYNLEAKKLKEIDFKQSESVKELNPQVLKDYITAYRRNQRQWSANTKGRSEVSHSNKKPHRQKGTGRARQGSLAAPQYKGGGVVFGPKPKFDQHVRINQKEKRAAIKSLVQQKAQDNKLLVLASVEMKEPKTKIMVDFMAKCGLNTRTLFVLDASKENKTESAHANFKKSIQNLKKADFATVNQVNAYNLLRADFVVMTEASLKQFMEQV